MGDPYFVHLPAAVYYRTKSNTAEVVGDADEADYAWCKAYVTGAPFGSWYLGGGGVACGTQASVSSFIPHVDAFAGAAAVQFKVVWPDIPEGTIGFYTIREGGTGYIRDQTSLWPTIDWPEYNPAGAIADGWVDSAAQTICIEAWVEYYVDGDPPCDEMEATDITFDGATLHGASATHWQWGTMDDEVGTESETGILTGLEPDTEYWYKALSYCETHKYKFRTKKEDDDETWTAAIITLPATEVWATGGTMHGLFWYQGNSAFYVALGFEYGTGTLTGNDIRWLYTIGSAAKEWGVRGFKMPIQMTVSGLVPDTTYNYRACLHLHNSDGTLVPMDENNYFGETMQFGGPVSVMGEGRKHVTAKQLEDDISKMAAGRYYMDHDGDFKYESRYNRDA